MWSYRKANTWCQIPCSREGKQSEAECGSVPCEGMPNSFDETEREWEWAPLSPKTGFAFACALSPGPTLWVLRSAARPVMNCERWKASMFGFSTRTISPFKFIIWYYYHYYSHSSNNQYSRVSINVTLINVNSSFLLTKSTPKVVQTKNVKLVKC
jgi:hypothetical protein